MMKRTVLTFAAVAAIAAPALVAPALFTPANAQASLNIGLSMPGSDYAMPAYPAPSYGYGYVARPVYAWGESWHRWDGGWNRGWDRHEWRERHWDHDRDRHWEHHGEGHHWR